ncbi:MAG: cyclic nucleotide-binding domain-containing protein [Bdellovibrionia bacterium]
MRLELTPLKINPSKKLQLSTLQQQYLEVLLRVGTIKDLNDYFLSQGWLVSFTELKYLLWQLLKTNSFSDLGVAAYLKTFFEPTQALSKTSLSKDDRVLTINEISFFRQLQSETKNVLIAKSKRVRFKAGDYICKQGSQDRILYALAAGSCGVYRQYPQGYQLLAQIEKGAVFGEAGFFLNQPRSAHIVALDEVEVIAIEWQEDWKNWMNQSKATELQIRFWIQHALSVSPLFKNLPTDTLDALAMVGRAVSLDAKKPLCMEGQAGSSAFFVIQGRLVASQKGAAIREMGQGDFIGEIALMKTGGVRTASIHALDHTLLLEIDQKSFYQLLTQNIFLAAELEALVTERILADQQRKPS